MKHIVWTKFSKQARRTGGESLVQLSVLFIGLAMAATLAFMPAQLASRILHPGAPAIGGGISEEQILDPSVAEDPDAVVSSSDNAQSSTAASGSGGQPGAAASAEYPLRSYWWYPLAAAGGLFILLAFGSKSSNAVSLNQGQPAPHQKPDSRMKPPAHQAKNVEEIETSKGAAPAAPHSEPHAEPSKVHFEESADEQKTDSSPVNTVAVTQKQMLEFAKVLSLVKEENLLSGDEYKAIHAGFQATDNSGKKWTVNLKSQGWFEKVDGKWRNSTPPDTLYLSCKTNDSILKYAKQLKSRH
jgi:hypothetical protein